jgi:hypothetical protein
MAAFLKNVGGKNEHGKAPAAKSLIEATWFK